MITAMQPRSQEVRYKNGVIAYIFEFPDGQWAIRYCTRPHRGSVLQELPETLRGEYTSANATKRSIARHYGTTITPIQTAQSM